MRTAIEQARIEQAQWKARVAADEAALDVAEREAAAIRDRLNASKRAYVNLSYAIQQWDGWHAGRELPNTPDDRPSVRSITELG